MYWPPKEPIPNGVAPTSMLVRVGAALFAESGAVVLITRWTVRPSFMLWFDKFSWSFIILPAKIKHNCSGKALNFLATASLNWEKNKYKIRVLKEK